MKSVETIYTFAHRAKSRSRNRYRVPTVGMKSAKQRVDLLIQSNRRFRKAIRVGKILNQIQMKKLAFISGELSSSLTVLGILFKMMHWPGAGILLVLGLGILSLLFIPSLTKYLYDKSK